MILVENIVYKIFDYRQREQLPDQRTIQCNCNFLPNAQLYYSGTSVNIISYDFIPGSHAPQHCAQLRAVVENLLLLHNQNYVHGDIRASNIVFADDFKKSQLIDFDFCGKDSRTRYPQYFNRDIDDGQRHEDAVGGALLAKCHDWHSLAFVFATCAPYYECFSDHYSDMCEYVRLGKLRVAIELLEEGNYELFSLDDRDGSTLFLGTGSPLRPTTTITIQQAINNNKRKRKLSFE